MALPRSLAPTSVLLLLFAACGTAAGTGGPADTAAGADSATAADSAAADSATPDAADAGTDSADVTADTSADTAPDTAGNACEHVVPCTDSQILDLQLRKKPSTRLIQNTVDGQGFKSHVDASAGGMSPTESYVYARFTDSGLERVDVGDLAALESVAWDIAFQRYLIRLNSGVSGPSCVRSVTLPPGSDYETLTAAPAGITPVAEHYYDETCTMVPDDSGLGGPATRLATFWQYANCVQMTGEVYVLELADGRRLKLTVTDYYPPAAQATCNETGKTPAGTAGGQVRVRWAFFP